MPIKSLEGRSLEEVRKFKPMRQFLKTGVFPELGVTVKTKRKIEPKENCRGFFVMRKYLDARKPDTIGTYVGVVASCGGDVWWIQHKEDDVAAYMYDELTDV